MVRKTMKIKENSKESQWLSKIIKCDLLCFNEIGSDYNVAVLLALNLPPMNEAKGNSSLV